MTMYVYVVFHIRDKINVVLVDLPQYIPYIKQKDKKLAEPIT